jgi:dipeptidyl aminopeptidase/acylaminoacyl peptidase
MARHRLTYTLPVVAGLAAVGGAVAGAAFALSEYVVRRMTDPPTPRRPVEMGFTPFETGADHVDVTFPGGHGLPLQGWLFPRGEQAPTILACGGYRGQRSDLLGIATVLWRAGFNTLIFDYTGYGDEPGPVTLGYWELADARAALDFLRRRFPAAPLGTIGYSMGAAISIMLAAREPDVRAVFADSPFTEQREIVRYHLAREFHLSLSQQTEAVGHLLLDLVDRRLSRLFGFRFADVSPLRDVARLAPRPLFLVHGEADAIIPVEHTRRLEAAAREAGVPVVAWYVPGGGHCDAYFRDRQVYSSRVVDFLAAHMGMPRVAPGPAVVAEAPNGRAAHVARRATVRPPAALS